MGQVAAVYGASGYAGGELLRLLGRHPSLAVGPLVAGKSVGMRVSEIHPNLSELADRTFVAADVDVTNGADIVFLALPHGESASVVRQLPEELPVIDLGADFRLQDAAAWTRYYSGAHAGAWVYGLPEIYGHRDEVRQTHRVANPGCYATAVALAAAPAIASGMVNPADVVVVAASGTTGAGRGTLPSLLGSEVMGSLSAYKVGGSHQHTPEMEQTLQGLCATPVRVSFTPMLAPMPRGILATVTMRTVVSGSAGGFREAYEETYAKEPFVRLLPAGQWPRTSDVLGSNSAHLQIAVDDHAERVIVVCAIDNLGKGAAGQALQNANLMLGYSEGAGLDVNGVAP